MEKLTIASDYSEEISRLKKSVAITREEISFELVSEATYNDFKAVDAAAKNRVKVTLSDKSSVDFSEIDDILERALVRLSYAKEQSDKEYAESEIVKIVTDKWQLTFFEEDIEKLSEKVSVDKIKEKISAREAAIRLSHSSTWTFNFVEKYNAIYKNLSDISEKVIVYGGPMAGGKSEAMRPMYNQAAEAGDHPILVTGKRSIASNFFPDTHSDHYQSSTHSKRKGVVSVINSLVSDKYIEDRKKCRVVFIDEVEDLFSHIATGTVGTEYQHRIDVMSALEELLKGADKVVVAEAMITNMTLEKICKMAGGKAKIYKTRDSEMPTIKLAAKDETIGVTRERLISGKKTAVFMDYNAKAFSDVAEALSHETEKTVLKLNAEYFEKSGNSLSDLDKILTECDAALISPVINAGTSITSSDYDQVTLLAGRTITPTAGLQAARRFRAANTINLAFRGGRSSTRITDPVSFICSMIKDSENPVSEAIKLYEDEHGKFLADYATAKNKQFLNFEQTLVIAAQQMGFKIERPVANEKAASDGQKASKAGRKKNAQVQKVVAFETSEALEKANKEGVDLGSTEERTFEQEVAGRTISGMGVLGLSKLTEEAYDEIFAMNIDKVVRVRKMLSGKEELASRMQIAKSRVLKLLEDAGINLANFFESRVTTETAEAAYDRLIEPVAINDEATMTGLELLKLFFDEFGTNVTAKYKTVVIKNIMREMGYDLVVEENGRDRYYNVSDLVKRVHIDDKKQKCNITKISDKYTGFLTLRNDFDYNASPETVQLLVTVDEKRLAKSIENKNETFKKEAEENGVNDWIPSFSPKYKTI
ncbi:hypothetical protein SAMN04487962_1252 [Marinobacter segnicrescens]|uniref:Uncharacterized protein n=1 Tax=Marinobacter segnicrescens TaxID=430453 RepID=A0A1I0H9D3_9GAMM|nr:hypothetical protein [Marinobacter segnicrescens]SET79512.1 hypothetical protein SAMN04487962_1252 [Marinobacter segnicrescens]